MKIFPFYYYAVFAFVVGAFWHSSYKADRQLQQIYAKPDHPIDHRTVESAMKEIENLRIVEHNLRTLHHQSYLLHTKAAGFALLLALPLLLNALRARKNKPTPAPSPSPAG